MPTLILTLQNPVSSSRPALDRPQSLAGDPNLDRLKKLYQANHQAEFLYLQAEADTLLCQLQAEIKVRRLTHS